MSSGKTQRLIQEIQRKREKEEEEARKKSEKALAAAQKKVKKDIPIFANRTTKGKITNKTGMERAEALIKILQAYNYDETSLATDMINYYKKGNNKNGNKNGSDILVESKKEIRNFLFEELNNKKKSNAERIKAAQALDYIFGIENISIDFNLHFGKEPQPQDPKSNYFNTVMDSISEDPIDEPTKNGLVAPRTFSLRVDNGRAMYSNVFTRKCSERRTFMRGGTALNLYVEPGASFRGHHWRTMLKTMYADKLPSKFDLYHARGKVDMAALVDGNMTLRGYK